MPTIFGCGFSIPLVPVVMFPLHLPFFVLTHIWVVPIYVLYVVATVLVCVGIFVVLLPPILEWSYPLFVFGHTISV